MNKDLEIYRNLLEDIKSRIRQSQIKATLSVNAEMIAMYWDIGRIIDEQQKLKGWSSSVIPNLSKDLKNELPEQKGFSERNLSRMLAFFREYENLPQAVAKMNNHEDIKYLICQIPWGHNILLIEKIKDINTRLWYVQEIIKNGWSRETLNQMLKNHVFERSNKAITNFEITLPSAQSELAKQSIKDPYIFDFLTISEHFQERELETELIKHLEHFLLELGTGFAFVGRQYHLEISKKIFT